MAKNNLLIKNNFIRIITRITPYIVILFSILFKYIPLKTSFNIVIIAYVTSPRIGLMLTRAFAPRAMNVIAKNPNYNFFSVLSNRFPIQGSQILLHGGLFELCLINLKNSSLITENAVELALLESKCLLELGKINEARNVLLSTPISSSKNNAKFIYQLAILELDKNNTDSAKSLLLQVIKLDQNYLQPHQNIAAKYHLRSYIPTNIDLIDAENGLLFDAYNFLGQRLTHIGMGDKSVRSFENAFKIQDNLKCSSVKLSSELQIFLQERNINLNNLNILSWEWSTQIGHQGMLDILFRMKDLGWWNGDVILLAPQTELIANHYFMALFDKKCHIIYADELNYKTISSELFSLQRYYGMSFNAWRFPDNSTVPWQDAAALAMQRWDEEGRVSDLRIEFETRYGSYNEYLNVLSFTEFRSNYGLCETDWYVCIHFRDSSFYGEITGNGQTHRNASVNSYIEAIQYITNKGGWVIKMGGKLSPKLPKMPRVIDYARSRYKSELLDIQLIKNANYFIGTTSGLTNIAISFNIPCALVNCITTDAQLWHKLVRFTLKPIFLNNNRMLSQREITTTPWRWRMFSADLLRHNNSKAFENTSEEILETVKEVHHLAMGGDYLDQFPSYNFLIESWQKNLSFIHFYGCAQPSIFYLYKYRNQFLEST